jgi:RNA polymerase sigma factor (sigma-70 family)
LNFHSGAVGIEHPDRSRGEVIVEALRNDEDWAVAELSRRVTPIIRNKIYAFDDWEDVLQQCLLEIVVFVRSAATITNLWGLVKQVAVTTVIDHNRGHQKSRARASHPPKGVDGEPENPTAHLPDRRPLPDAVLEGRDLFLYIYQRIGKTCREIIDLVYIEGITYERAAEELGVQEGALRVRIHRCRERALRIRSEAAVF